MRLAFELRFKVQEHAILQALGDGSKFLRVWVEVGERVDASSGINIGFPGNPFRPVPPKVLEIVVEAADGLIDEMANEMVPR